MNVIQVGSDQTPPGVVVTERENSMAGKFELYKDAKWQVPIPAQGGQRRDHRGAKNGIASVQKNAPDATVVDLTE